MGRGQTQARWTIVFATVLAGVALSVAAVAYACTPGSSVTLDQEAGVAGSNVDGAAEGFNSGAVAQPVEIRFNSLDGPVVWSGVPNSAGKVLFSFRVPEVEPGTYTVVATQSPGAGVTTNVIAPTARASFEVQAAAAAPPVPAPGSVVQPAAPAAQAAPSAKPTTQRRPASRRPAPAAEDAPVAPAAVTQPAAAIQPALARSSERQAPSRSRRPAAIRPGTTSVAASAPRDAAGISSAVPPSQRRAVVAPADGSGSSNVPTILALAMLGLGCVLSLGAGGLVLAGRRSEKTAPAEAIR